LIPATLTCVALTEAILYYKNPEYKIYKLIMKPLAFLGLCSYSVYLIHQPYLGYLIGAFNPGTKTEILNSMVGVVISVTIFMLLSYVLYRLLEVNSIAIGQRLRSKYRIKEKI
jgi:peptidoglycan/LPS O-acetylase OafA/YrhL